MNFDLQAYLKELTNYELIESYFLVRNALISDVTIYMTILFAYITVAYFVSAKLTRFQAISISVLYSVFSLYMISSAHTASQMLSVIGYEVSGVDSSWEPNLILLILLVSWVFSIILFRQARRLKKT